MQVKWETHELLALTECVDVWYLFPLRDVTHQLAISRSGIGPKEDMLDAVLSSAWRELCSLPTPTLPEVQEEEQRDGTKRQIEVWFRAKLQGRFAYVSEPLPLMTDTRRQTFSLFLAVANSSKAATDLAKHFHRYFMKHFAPSASRRTSDH